MAAHARVCIDGFVRTASAGAVVKCGRAHAVVNAPISRRRKRRGRARRSPARYALSEAPAPLPPPPRQTRHTCVGSRRDLSDV
eukprot:6195263-Pleurochrysis_carterae.AAC.1